MRIANQLYPPQYPPQKSGINTRFLLIIIGVAVLATVLALYFAFGSKPKPFCGNKICDKGETCISCLQDCPCPTGQYCSQKSNGCASAVCGNKICEITESSDNCCKDCSCYKPGEVCNITKNKCEKKEFPISDDKAKELITKYFSDQGKNVTSLEFSGLFNNKNKLLKSFRGYVDGFYENILIYEDGKIEIAPLT